MPGLEAGRLDRRVRIEREIPGEPTNTGAPGPSTFVLVASVWAEKRPLGGRELWTAAQVEARVDTRFVMRYRDDVTPERMRLVDENGRVHDIRAVQELGRREGLEILALARGEEP